MRTAPVKTNANGQLVVDDQIIHHKKNQICMYDLPVGGMGVKPVDV